MPKNLTVAKGSTEKPFSLDCGKGERRGALTANFILAPDVEVELIAIAGHVAEDTQRKRLVYRSMLLLLLVPGSLNRRRQPNSHKEPSKSL